ncbi:MAG: GTPase RsgA, partial [Ktedonobacteraceae bacterium]|nr:GTPase RsgA [Ktedonobacteraceae bacterium]
MLQEPETLNEPETLTGVVLNGAHGIYDIHTQQGVLRCTLRGKLKKAFAQATKTADKAHSYKGKTAAPTRHQRAEQESAVAPVRLSVGDRVRIRRLDAGTGLIEEILPRQSALTRKDVGSKDNKLVMQTLLANLDQVVLVFATAEPEPHFGMLDRYLAICESAQVRAVV